MRDLSLGKHLTLSFVVSSMLFNSALALPSGGAFTNGTQGNITTNGNTMNITGTTSSGKHVITWGGGFNIASGETVNFTTDKHYYLNLDYSKNSSKLYGTLNGGTNNIFLVNPNGTVIGNGAVINANKFAVSTKALSDTQIQEFTSTGKFSPVFEPSVAGDIDIQTGSDIRVSELTLVGDKIVFAGGVNAKEGMKVTSNAIEVNSGTIESSKTIDFSASTLIEFKGGVLDATTLNATAGAKSNLNSNSSQKGQINLSSSSDLDIEGELTLTADNIKGSANISAKSLTFTADDAINLTGGTIATTGAQSLSSNWINIDSTTLSGANITLKGTGDKSVAELNGATITSTGILDIDAYQVELNKKSSTDTTISATNGVDIDATNQIAVNGATFNDSNLNLQATNKIDIKDTNFNIQGKTLTLTSEEGIINIAATTSQNAASATIKADDINFNSGAILSANTLNIDASNNAIFNGSTIIAYHDATFKGDYIGAEGANFTFGKNANPAEFFANNISFKDSTFIGTNGKSGITLDAEKVIELEGNTFQELTQLKAEANQITWESGTIANSVDNAYFHAKENQLLIKGGTLNAANMTLSADKYLNISGGTFSNTTLNLLGKNLIDLTGGSLSANTINIDKVEDSDTLTVNFTNGTMNAANSLSADASKIVVGGTVDSAQTNPSLTANNLTLSADQIAVESGVINATSNGTLSAVDKIDLNGGAINGGHLRFETTSTAYNSDPTKGGVINFDGSTITSDATGTAIDINADQINFNSGTLKAENGSINANANHKIVVNGSEFEVSKGNDLTLNGEKEVEIKKDFGDNFNGNATITTDEEEGNIDISLESGETLKGENLEFVSAYLDLKSGTITANGILSFEAYNKLNLGSTSSANLQAATMNLITHNVMNIAGGTLNSTTLNLKGINDDKTATGENGGVVINISGGTLASVGTLNTSGADQLNFNSDTNWQANEMNINSKRVVLNGAILASDDLNFGTAGGDTEYIDIKSGTLNANSSALELYASSLISINGGNLTGSSIALKSTENASDKGLIEFNGGTLTATGTITANATQIDIRKLTEGETFSGIDFDAAKVDFIASKNLYIRGGDFSDVTNLNFTGNGGIEFSGGTFDTDGIFKLTSDGGLVEISRSGTLQAGSFTVNAGGIDFSNLDLSASDIAFDATRQIIINSGTLNSATGGEHGIKLTGLDNIHVKGGTITSAADLTLNSNNYINISGGYLKGSNLNITALPSNNSDITSGGLIEISGGTLENSGSDSEFTITANQIDVKDNANLKAAKDLSLTANNKLNIEGGSFTVENGTLDLNGQRQLNLNSGAFNFGSNGNLKLTSASNGQINYTNTGSLNVKDLTINGGEINLTGANITASGAFDFDASGWINLNSSTLSANGADINGGAISISGGTLTNNGTDELKFTTGGQFNIANSATITSNNGINISEKSGATSEFSLAGGSLNAANGTITIDTDEINIASAIDANAIKLGNSNTQNVKITAGADLSANDALALKATNLIYMENGSLGASDITFENTGYTNIKDGEINAADSITFTQNGNANLLRIEGGTISTGNASTANTGTISFEGSTGNFQIYGGDFDTATFKADNVKQFIVGNTANAPTIIVTTLNLNASNNLAIANGDIDATTATLQSANLINITGGDIDITNKLTISGDKKVNITGGTINAQNIDFITKNYIYLGGNAQITATGNIDFVANNGTESTVSGTVEFAGATVSADTITIGEADEASEQRVEQIIFNGGSIEGTTSLDGYAKQIYVKNGTLKSSDLYLEGAEKISLTGGTIDNGGKFIEFVSGKIIELGIALTSDTGDIKLTAPQLNIVKGADINAGNNLTLVSTGDNSDGTLKGGLYLGGGTLTAGNTLTLVGENGIAMMEDPSALTISAATVNLFSNNYINITGSITGNNITLSGFEGSGTDGDPYKSKVGQETVIELANTDITGTSKDSSTLKIDGQQINLSGSKNISNFDTANFTASNQVKLEGGTLSDIDELNLQSDEGEILVNGATIANSVTKANLKSNNHIALNSGTIAAQSLNLSGVNESDKPKVIDFGGATVNANSGTLTANAEQINITGGSVNASNIDFTAINIMAEGGTLTANEALKFTTQEGTGDNQNGKIEISGASLDAATLNLISANLISISGGTLKGTNINLGDDANKNTTVIDITGGTVGESTSVIDVKGAQINIGGVASQSPTINGNTLTLTASNQILVKNGILNLLTASLTATNLIDISGGELKANLLTLTANDTNKGKISISNGTIQGNNGDTKTLTANAKWIDISGGVIGEFGTIGLTASDILQVSGGTFTADAITFQANNKIALSGGSFHGITDGTNTLKLLSDNLVQISGGTFDIKTTEINGITGTGTSTDYSSSLKELILTGGTFNKAINAYANDINFKSGTLTFNASGASFRAAEYINFGSVILNASNVSALNFTAQNGITASGATFSNTGNDSTLTFQTMGTTGYIGLTNTNINGFSTVSANSGKDLELDKTTINTQNLKLSSTGNTVIENSSSLTTSSSLDLDAKGLKIDSSTLTANGSTSDIDAIGDLVFDSSTLTINSSTNTFNANNIWLNNSSLTFNKGATFTATNGTFQSKDSSMILIGGVSVSANANDIIISGAKDNGDSIELRGGSTINLKAENALKITDAKFKQINATGSNSNKYNFEAANRISVDGAEFYGSGSNSKLAVSFKTTAADGSIDLTSVNNTLQNAVGSGNNTFTVDSNLVEFKGGNNLQNVSTGVNTDFINFSNTNTIASSTLDATKLIDIAGSLSLNGTTFKSSGNIESENGATINLSGTNNFYAAYQKYTGTSFSGSGSTLNFKGYDGSAATKIEFQTGTNFSNISTINANATGILVNGGTVSNVTTIDFDASSDLQITNSNLSATNVNLDGTYLYINGGSLTASGALNLNTADLTSAYTKLDGAKITAGTLTMGKDSKNGSVIDILNSSTITSNTLANLYADGIYLNNSQLNLNGGQEKNNIKALSEFVANTGTINLNGGLTIDGGKEIEFSGATFTKSGNAAKLWLRTTGDMSGTGNNGVIKITNSKFGGDSGNNPLDLIQVSNSDGNAAGANDLIINGSTINAKDMTWQLANNVNISNSSNIAGTNLTVNNAKDFTADNSSINVNAINLTLSNLIKFSNGTNITAGTFKANGAKQTTFDGATININSGTSDSGIFTGQIDFKNNSKFTLNGGAFDFAGTNAKFQNSTIDVKNSGTIGFSSTDKISFSGATLTNSGANAATFNIGNRNNGTESGTLDIEFANTKVTANSSTTIDLKASTKDYNTGGEIDLSGLSMTSEIGTFNANANKILIANGSDIKASAVALSTPNQILMTGGTITASTFTTSSGVGTGMVFLRGGNLNANTITLGGKEVQILASDKQNKGTTIHGKSGGSSNATTVTVDANTVGYINASSVYANTINNQNANGWTSMNIDELSTRITQGSSGPTMTGSAKSYLNIATSTTATANANQWYQFVKWFNAGDNGVNSYDQYNLLNDINFNWANLAASNTYGLINNFTNQTFNGNGHTLSNFNIGADNAKYSSGTYAGLIQNATNSEFKNIIIDGAWMNLSGNTIQYAGILVGNAANNSVFDNIKFKDNIGITANISKSGGAIYVGGVAGKVSAGSSFTNIDVNNAKINATNTYSSDTTGWAYAGGLAGMITEGATVDKIYMNNITVNAITKGQNSRAFAGGFSGVMQNDKGGTVAVSNVVMNGITVKAQAPNSNAGTGVNPSFAGAFTNVSLEANLNAAFTNIFIYLKSLSVQGSYGTLRSFFVGAYNSDYNSKVTSTNAHIYTSETYSTITLQGRDSIWLDYNSASGGKAQLHRGETATTNWENMVTKQYDWTTSSQGFYDISKIQGTATPSSTPNWSAGSMDPWNEATANGGKTGVINKISGSEKDETDYVSQTESADENENTATEITTDITVSDSNGGYDSDSTSTGTIGNDYDPTDAKGSDTITHTDITSADKQDYGNLDDSLTDIVIAGTDTIDTNLDSLVKDPNSEDITGTAPGDFDESKVGDTEKINDGQRDATMDDTDLSGKVTQPSDTTGNENGNGGNEGGDGEDNGVSDLDPSGNGDITNSGEGDKITISDDDKAASNNANNAGELINKKFTNITYTGKDYSFNSDDYSADILSEILEKITNGYYVLDVEDFEAAYKAAQNGDISGFLKILQVSDAEKAETIRQAMDFMKEFYGSNGLGETIYTSNDEKFTSYNEKAHNLKASKGDLWEFIYGTGEFDDKVENFFKDYEKYAEYKEQLKDLNTKYNEFKAYMDSMNLDENSETYKEMSAKLEEIQEQYNTLKDKADAFIDETMKPQQDYIQGVFEKTDNSSNGHFKFADDSGRIYDDFDYTKDFGGEEVPPMPDQQPDTPETPNIDPKMFTDITDQADVLETDDKENEIDEAAGEDRQRLCVVSDNAKTMNPCLAPK